MLLARRKLHCLYANCSGIGEEGGRYIAPLYEIEARELGQEILTSICQALFCAALNLERIVQVVTSPTHKQAR
jgi:hypothetical protein